jgi:hypothetical protein
MVFSDTGELSWLGRLFAGAIEHRLLALASGKRGASYWLLYLPSFPADSRLVFGPNSAAAVNLPLIVAEPTLVLAALDRRGEGIWGKIVGRGAINPRNVQLLIHADESISIAGVVHGHFVLSPDTAQQLELETAGGSEDAVIARFREDGELVPTSVVQLGGQYPETLEGAALLGDDVAIAGIFHGTATVHVGSPKRSIRSTGRDEGYWLVSNPSGSVLSIGTIGSTGDDHVSIAGHNGSRTFLLSYATDEGGRFHGPRQERSLPRAGTLEIDRTGAPRSTFNQRFDFVRPFSDGSLLARTGPQMQLILEE